jgi:hypothetical protein
LLRYKGKFAEADIFAQRALREDAPLENARDVFVQLFYSSLLLGDTEKAAEWCQRGRLSIPADWYFVECQLTLMRHDLHSKPDPGRAWALVDTLDKIDPSATARATGRPYNPIYRRVVAATISARAGRRDIARAELARAKRATAGDRDLQRDLVYDEAYLRIVLGERKRATELVREMLRARPMLRPFLARDPLFQNFPLPK